MNIEFATCNKNTAFEYLKKVYPSREIKEDEVNKLLELVDKDIVRVRDPFMYGKSIGIIAGNKYNQSHKQDIDNAIAQLKENNLL